ncbi:hypothetical protein WAX88_06945 [Photobacterium damselae subsp. damselae]|uniref:hypothetical protein n=1 Tax=Photobacterium damselae TaxID=38293 RepID=UPI00311B2623
MNLCLRNSLILALCLFSSFTVADCNAQLKAITYSSGGEQYQVFGQQVNGLTQHYSLIIDGGGQRSCPLFLVIEPAVFPWALINNDNKRLEFDLEFKHNQIRQDSSKVIVDFSGENERISTQFSIRYPADQVVASGQYQGRLKFTLTANPHELNQYYDKEELTLQVAVVNTMKLSLYGIAGQYYRWDLGDLTQSGIRTNAPNLYIQSTEDFYVEVSSLNKGNLRHHSGQSKWDIPYQLLINSKVMNLHQVSSKQGYRLQPDGIKIPIEVEVPSVTQQRAGEYRDSVEIMITPTLGSY